MLRDITYRQGAMGLLLAVALAAGLGVPSRAAQRGPGPPLPSIKPPADMVGLRVTITGPRNKPLPRLTAENLRITEDGVEQRIEHFAFDTETLSVAIVWGILNDSLSAEARLAPLAFLETLAKSAPPRSINDRIADLSRRQLGTPLFEYFLVEGALQERGSPAVRIAFSTDVKALPRIYPSVRGSLDAVYVGLDVLKEAAFSKKALVMIADSVDATLSIEHYKQFAIREGVPVYYIIADGAGGEGPLQLQELTDVSGGEGYLALSGGTIESYALEIAQGLNNQYWIGYHPKKVEKDGKWRKLGVRVTPPDGSPKLHARVKSGYYAPKEPTPLK
jgi:Ca-activated chloride channel family protein